MTQMEKDFMDFFVRVMGSYGFKDLPLRIAALLYIEPEEVSLEEIADKTGYSLSSISLSVRSLETSGMVERRRKPGSRKVYFYMEKSLLRTNIRKLKATQEHLIGSIKSELPGLIAKYKPKAKDEYSRKRLRIIENYNSQITAFGQILAKWQKDLEKLEESNG